MRISRLRRPRFFAASIFRIQPVYTLLGFALIGTALILGFRESETKAGAADLSSVVTVNAASYDGAVSPGAIAAAFGTALAARSDQAGGIPLPTELAGTTVRLLDSRGFEHSAPLFFVSAGQINYLIPEDAALGSAKITIANSQGAIAEGEVQIINAAPAVFTFASNGRGVPVGLTTYDGAYFESIVNADGSPRSITAGTPWQPNYVTLFGTGLRNSADLRVRISGIEVTPFYAGPQGHFVGLDQVNFVLPPNLPSGSNDLLLTTGGRASNHVQLMVGSATVPTQTGLTLTDVQTVIGQAVARAQALNLRATIAVLDHEGNNLGVFRMTGANPLTRIGSVNLQTGQILKPTGAGGLEGLVVPAEFAAISKAGTAAFFSTQGNAFSTRSASFIVQEHLPPLINFQPGGPLFGVQISQLPCSDIKIPNLPLGLAGDPGGVPLYKNGVAAGGIGVELDGFYSVDIDASDFDQSVEEIIAVAGTLGFESPLPIRGDQIYVDGIRLPFINAPQTGTAAPAFNTLPGTVLAAFPVRGVQPSRFEPFTLGGVPGRIDRRFFPFRGSTATGRPALTAAEVTQMLGQAAQQAYRMRAAIRRPLGSPVEVNITVVDVDGEVLGLFSTFDAPIFGFDVSVQKARTAAFFSKATAGAELRAAGFGRYVDAAAADGLSLAGQIAFSARGFGFLNRPFFPDGIDGAPNGPFSVPITTWSPFNVGIQTDLVGARIGTILGGGPNGPCTAVRGLPNGIQIFAGSVPVYKNGVLVGAVGISGDGIDQDDTVAATGSVGFEAADSIRTDQVFVRGVRLPYVKFPRHPNL
jgi:uncharacterized protein (TIGR03437 family)